MKSPRRLSRRSLTVAAAVLCFTLIATDALAQVVVPQVTFQSNVRGATVFVNGQRRGTTPLTLRLRAGNYNVRLEAAGRAAVTRTIRVTSTGRQAFQIDFTAARATRPATRQVSIAANTGAMVFINGQERGETPVTLPIVAGEYQLQLEAPGFLPLAATLTVSNQARQFYEFELSPALATLIVDLPDRFLNKRLGDPRVARGQLQLLIDGEPMDAGQPVLVPAGVRLITVVSGGFGFSQEANLQSGIEYTLRMVMAMEVLETGVTRPVAEVNTQRGVSRSQRR